jgi:hypothetical protein
MKTLAALATALALVPAGAAAQTHYDIVKECKFDMEQYCKDIKRVRIRDLRECLAKHEKDLFPRCRDHYQVAR